MRTLQVVLLLTTLAASIVGLAADKPTYAPPAKEDVTAVQKQGRYVATVTMTDGKTFSLVLEGQYMPLTVANFVKLINAKYYDGIIYHRVVNEKKPQEFRIIQGGDPKANGTGGPGYLINLEISPFLAHKTGALSMARTSQPNSAGSQFFITLCDIPFLDGNYAVFGWVNSGLNVIEGIKQGDTMQTVTVEAYAGTEKCPLLIEGCTPDIAPGEKKD